MYSDPLAGLQNKIVLLRQGFPLAEEADNEYVAIDSIIVRVHQHAAGAKRRGGKQRALDAPEAG